MLIKDNLKQALFLALQIYLIFVLHFSLVQMNVTDKEFVDSTINAHVLLGGMDKIVRKAQLKHHNEFINVNVNILICN